MFKNYLSLIPADKRKVSVFSGEPALAFQREMNRFLDRASSVQATAGLTESLLSLDVCESEKEIVISADMPGVSQKDISITLSNKLLTISGNKETERTKEEGNYHLTERCFGSFTRSLELPMEVDPDKIEAKYSRGVLSIRLPKSERAQANVRKIEVHAA